jgi:hypothetical protein
MLLSRTAGETRFDVLGPSAEKLLGRTLPTLTQPSESAVLISAILASFLAHRALCRCAMSQTNKGVS